METSKRDDGPSYTISEGPNVWRTITNPREEAILDVLGGRSHARVKLGMTRQAIHQILTVDRVKDVESAERIAKATKDEGREVPAIELLGLAPWGGPKRHDNGGGSQNRSAQKRPPKGSASVAMLRESASPAEANEARLTLQRGGVVVRPCKTGCYDRSLAYTAPRLVGTRAA